MNKNSYYDILMTEVTVSVAYRVFGLERFDEGQRVFLHSHPRITRWFCFDRDYILYTPSEYERMKYFIDETEWRDERIDTILKKKE
jgi:hypothetical protein